MIDRDIVSATRADTGRPGRSLVIVLLVGLLLLLVGLDGTPLRGLYDDVDRALIARNMAQSGDWLVANYLDRPLLTKPPLMYWSAGLWYRVTGRSDELPARLPSVLGMLVLALGTWHLGRRLADDRTGLLAALLLLTMHLFLAMARQPLIDTVMLAGFGVCLAAVAELLTAPAPRRTRWWLLLTAGFAWSVMTKGPVLLPLLLLLLLPFARGPQALRPAGRQAAAMLGLFLLLVVPWHVVMLLAVPDAPAVWRTELLGRFTGSSEFHAWTQKPWWFYLPDLANTLPWLPLWLGGLVWAWQRRRHDRLSRLLLWWTLGGLVYFTLASATKRSYYLLPLYPAFALLAATFWLGWRQRRPDDGFPLRLLQVAWIATSIVVAGLLAASVVALARGWLDWRWAVGLAVVLGSGGAVLARHGWRALVDLPALILAAGAVLLVYHAAIVPPLHAYLGGKPFYTEIRSLLDDQPPARLLLCRVHLTLTAFYLETQRFHEAQPATLAEHAARGGGGWLITRPDLAAGVPGLVPVRERTLHSPYGPETRSLGLYRLPD
jgi:4-amino-4-deoxy-L-arabinose transferase-like glycosyltransferase